jgi:hypothetical protein
MVVAEEIPDDPFLSGPSLPHARHRRLVRSLPYAGSRRDSCFLIRPAPRPAGGQDGVRGCALLLSGGSMAGPATSSLRAFCDGTISLFHRPALVNTLPALNLRSSNEKIDPWIPPVPRRGESYPPLPAPVSTHPAIQITDTTNLLYGVLTTRQKCRILFPGRVPACVRPSKEIP